MTPDRWEDINRLYYAALDVAVQERASFLDQACGNDPELRSEVESLLATHQEAGGFLGKPAMEEVVKTMQEDPPSIIGRQLGPYHILSTLGAGGMGEVYEARDIRLNRTVAIKVLPKHLSERTDLRQRLEREARAIASLDHPHICTLHDIGREQGTDFLVMQYLEGETLSQRLKRGPLPTAEVLRYAIEIVGGLDQAHRKGVIHRDLKPGNIMLTEAGSKLLDFGLAKQSGRRPQVGDGSPIGVGLPLSRTKSEDLTEEGMLLGTLEYMAPEQLEGKEADARTDIFALGVVIYEMATGRKAFEGDSKASVMAKILTAQPPPMTTIKPVTPPELDRVVQKCLAKKPEERWQSAAEVTSQLQEIAEANLEILKAQKRGKEPSAEAKGIASKAESVVPVLIPEPPNVLSRLIRSRAWKLSFVGVLLALVTGSLVVRQLWRQPEKPSEKPKEMSFKPLTSYSWDNPVESAAISPDGKYLAFGSKGKLFIQVIRTGEKRSLALPVGFQRTDVSWFPDGTKLLLGRDDFSLWSLSILGGAPQKIVDQGGGLASVSPDGSLIAFGRHDPERKAFDIWLVNVNGESPRRIRTPSERDHTYYPVWSSNGQRLFYLRNSRAIESCDLHGERVANIFSSKDNSVSSLCLVPDGRILFNMYESHPGDPMAADLWEIKVDTATGRPLSEARRLTQWSGFGSAQVFQLGITVDGKGLVMVKGHAQADVYVAELEPGGKAIKTPWRLTLVESDDGAWDWTADSRAVLFVSERNGNGDIFKQDINQTEAEAIVASPEYDWHPNLSPDRGFILYLVSDKRGAPATRLMRIPVGGGPPELVLKGEKIKYFSCAREANLCVVVEEVEGKQILTTFDTLKGRGQKLPISDFPNFVMDIQNTTTAIRILSPQGRLIEKMKPGPEGLHIRVRSLTGGAAEEITFKNLVGNYLFCGWSLDGKGIYITELTSSDFTLLYAGLDLRSQVLWKRGSSPGWTIHYPIPSPDGRYLAFTAITYESNAWMLENF